MFSVQGLWENCGVKRGRRIFLVVAACGVLAVVAGLFWPSGEPEPRYQGKKLSEWIAVPYLNGTDLNDAKRAEAAVREIGTNALPYLIRWINHPTPVVPTRVDAAIEKLNQKTGQQWIAFRYKKSQRASYSAWAFHILGPQAGPAIPQLTQLLRSTNYFVAKLALHALDGIGKEAVPILLGVLTNRQASGLNFQLPMWDIMCNLGTNSGLVIPALIQNLTNKDSRIAVTAASLLGSIGAEPDRVVPELAKALGHPAANVRCNAAYALGEFKEQGRPVLPSLIRALEDSSEPVRAEVTNALRVIAPEVLEKGAVAGKATAKE